MIACFLSNISAKYYKNLSMLSRVIAKNVGDVFLRHSVLAVKLTVHYTESTASHLPHEIFRCGRITDCLRIYSVIGERRITDNNNNNNL